MKQKECVTILVADDHAVVREGIIKSLSAQILNSEFEECYNSSQLINKVLDRDCDLIILDISMPGRSGMEALKEIKALKPEIKVIIFSMYPEDQFAVRALRAGASAYLTKEMPLKTLVIAVKKILNGERYMTHALTELITNEFLLNRKIHAHEILSDREYEVFRLISSGKSVSHIARDLDLSVKTISVYRANILKKMHLKNNAEIMHYAFKNNLAN